MSTSPAGASMPARRGARLLVRCLTAVALAVPGLAVLAPGADASTVFNLSLTGTSGTVLVGSTLYAKEGGALRLSVITSGDTQCVQLSGAFSARQALAAGRGSWVFSLAAGQGDGVRTITTSAFPGFDANGCTGTPTSRSASFVLDNTGPVVTGTLAPAPNAAGWNNSDVSITWSATDAGSGVASGPTPATDAQQTETAGVSRVAVATDRLGNSGNGAVSVKLDKGAPVVTASRSPAANGAGWSSTPVTVSFTCSDALSGISSCPAAKTVSDDAANQSVSGTAVDNAGNTSTATVSGIGVDTVPPTLSGAPTTTPGPDGWYTGDVTIHWTAADSLSGLSGPAPADSTITSEGTAQTASASVADRAGNTATATSSPVKIDKTAPTTTATAPTDWTTVGVTVALDASDGLSGVAATYYQLDSGLRQTGTSVPIASEGVHDLRFWSVDTAGNAETPSAVQVKIDRTAPTIHHTAFPEANAAGWNDGPVTVTFTCADGAGSGVASCSPAQTLADEGAGQEATGSAADAAGNTATDRATVNIDSTAPTVQASLDRRPNEHGWYDRDVTVTYACDDALSGIASCPAAQTVGEGTATSARGTATDVAGNTAVAGVSGVHVDTTAPTLSGAVADDRAHDGWYTGDVMVHWTASDDLSGLDGSAPSDSVVTGEGDDLSAAAAVSDLAGNTANATVSGIRIDRTAPTTAVTVPQTPTGWYAGNVLVTLTTGSDLSGIAATYYSIDGGPATTYTGPFRHALTGERTLSFWSVDKAGNVEDRSAPGHTVTLKVDGVAPTITGTRVTAANDNGWNNGPVTVSFTCTDEAVAIAGCSDTTTLTSEGSRQSVTGQARDALGTISEATVGDISIDLTKPTVTGTATTAPNAFGWYRGDVAIQWTGQDGLSGVDTTTVPGNSVIGGEGPDLGAGPVTLLDRAGNEGSGSVTGINIDRHAPTITGSVVDDAGAPRSPNAAGWYDSAARVRFACDDALSGVQECAGDAVLAADGADQHASGTATDKADNAATATVRGIDIDSQAPRTVADLQCNATNGYCRGDTATVVLTAADQSGLSGVQEIHYSADGGTTWHSTAGDSATVAVPLTGAGASRLLFYAKDKAGNTETQDAVDIRQDTIAPVVTHTLSPAPNAYGWNSDDVTVHFAARDESDGAGVDASTVTPDRTVSTETVGTVVRGSAQDRAGNVGTDSVSVKLDKTAPTISSRRSGTLGRNGWYTGPVTVSFDCADQGPVQSGTSACTADVVLSTDGRSQSAKGVATDSAGNTASTTVSGIDIDSTRPAITNPGAVNGAIYLLGDPAIPTSATACTASDTGSGVDSCVVTLAGGQPNGVGTFTFTATATDRAGNTATRTGTYRVIYRWDGFRQPINDTAHQVDQGLSIFKGGSTVPAKFQLKRADGSVVQANRAPQWLTPTMGSPTTALVGELIFTDPETSGSEYRWDAAGQQYQYNWSTKGSTLGYQYQVGVTLDDGQTYVVTIGLR